MKQIELETWIWAEPNKVFDRGAGWSADRVPVVQVAPPPDSHFGAVFGGRTSELDPGVVDHEVATLTEELMDGHPSTGAVVLECTNFVPWAATVRRIAKVPVFDLYTLGMQAYLATRA